MEQTVAGFIKYTKNFIRIKYVYCTYNNNIDVITII